MKYLLRLEAVLSLCFIILIIFSFDTALVAIMTILSAIIHELGHIAPMLLLKGSEPAIPRSRIDGLRILTKEQLSYRDELIVLLGGPCLNLIFSALFYVLHLKFGEYFYLFAIINLMTMLTNLLPINQYDGYKIIRCIILLVCRDAYSKLSVLDAVSFAICTVISIVTLYFILKLGEGYWIFSVLLYQLIRSIHRYNTPRKGTVYDKKRANGRI